jgi:hypothetical protein
LLRSLKSPVLVEVNVANLLDLILGGEKAVGVAELRELRMAVIDSWMVARVWWWKSDKSGNIQLV